MTCRIEPAPIEEAIRLGAEMGVKETQAAKNAFRVLARHPDLAQSVYTLLLMLSGRNRLPVRLRELMIMRIAWTTGSDYEWFQHFRIATTAGVAPDELVAVRDWRASTRFSAEDRAVLAAVDDTLTHGCIGDAAWADCERALGDAAVLVEMVVAIGNWIMFSQLLRSLRIPIEAPGVPWPPDGVAPERP